VVDTTARWDQVDDPARAPSTKSEARPRMVGPASWSARSTRAHIRLRFVEEPRQGGRDGLARRARSESTIERSRTRGHAKTSSTCRRANAAASERPRDAIIRSCAVPLELGKGFAFVARKRVSGSTFEARQPSSSPRLLQHRHQCYIAVRLKLARLRHTGRGSEDTDVGSSMRRPHAWLTGRTIRLILMR